MTAVARKPFEPLPTGNTGCLQGMPQRKRFTTIGLTDAGRDAARGLAESRAIGVATVVGVVFDEIVASGKLEEIFDQALKRSAER